MKRVLWTTIAVSTLLILGLIWEIRSLIHERDVYDWKFFTCRTLLDDPKTRAKMEVKWKGSRNLATTLEKRDKRRKTEREYELKLERENGRDSKRAE